MSGLANITIAGNLVADAERRDVGSDGLTEFRVAANVRRGGEDVAMFFTCTMWGRRGDALREYLTRGKQVTVGGEFATREYTTKAGEQRTSLEINVSSLALQGGGNREQRRDGGPPPPGDDYGPPSGGGGFGDDSDLPF